MEITVKKTASREHLEFWYIETQRKQNKCLMDANELDDALTEALCFIMALLEYIDQMQEVKDDEN